MTQALGTKSDYSWGLVNKQHEPPRSRALYQHSPLQKVSVCNVWSSTDLGVEPKYKTYNLLE